MTKQVSSKSLVLYADDDIDDQMLVREAFEQYADSVEIVTVPDGIHALSFLKNLEEHEESPCLIILDINMPKMDGKEALVELRQLDRFQEVPVILFTTSSQPVDKDFAAQYSAGFISKPIDYKQLDFIADTFIEHCAEEIKKKIRENSI